MSRKNNEYISLKEASEISGYSPDYIGQLIRGGKLPGRQVFQQVAWMTTEEDLRAYMQTKRSAANRASQDATGWLRRSRKRANSIETPRLAIRVLYVAGAIAVCLFLLLFYIFSSSLEHRLDQRALQTAEAANTP